jgi:hypothetical protein
MGQPPYSLTLSVFGQANSGSGQHFDSFPLTSEVAVFQGFVSLNEQFSGIFISRSTSRSPVDADSNPRYRVYSPSGILIANGSCTPITKVGVVSASQNTPIVIVTDAPHNIYTGDRVSVSGVVGNTAANGHFNATRIDEISFSLDNSAGVASYVSGGTVKQAGVYGLQLMVEASSGFEAGKTYVAVITYQIGGSTFSEQISFVVT